MKPVFDEDILKKAIAAPEQIKKAKERGVRFWHEDGAEGIGIGGYKYNGVVYITKIENLSKNR